MKNTDFLSLLDSVKGEVLVKRHPLSDEDVALRFCYAVGIGMIACADGALNKVEQLSLKDLAASLLIPKEQIDKVLSASSAPSKESIRTVLSELTKKEHQFLFLLGLQIMVNCDGKANEIEKQAIEKFADLFQLSSADLSLWRKLGKALLAGDFKSSEALFQKIYSSSETDVAEERIICAYRALVYFWKTEAIRDELSVMAQEAASLKTKLKEAILSTQEIEKAWGIIGANKPVSAEGTRIKPNKACIEARKQEIRLQSLIETIEARHKMLSTAIKEMYIK